MKRVLLTLTLILSSILSSLAYDCQVDGIYYDLNKANKTASVTYKSKKIEHYPIEHKSSYQGDISIPPTITIKGNTYSVTSIGFRAFCNCESITSIIIPNSVKYFGKEAFYNCQSLTSIDIPTEVTYIGEEAFYNCKGLTSIDIPNAVTDIGRRAFGNCSSLTSIDIPNSITTIEACTFSGCDNLRSIKIPNSVEYIRQEAFRGCKSLLTIDIPSSVKYIGAFAFKDCSNLRSIEIPNLVEIIDQQIFSGCVSLTTIVFPNSVKSIYYNPFEKCQSLKNILVSFEYDGPIPLGYEHIVKHVILEKTIEAYFASKPFMSWEEYYAKWHKKNPPVDKESIARSISNDIEQWQKKGEFESTAHWTQRVNEKTRTQRIDSLKAANAKIIQAHQNEYKQEYEELQQSYEFEYKAHYNKLSDEYISALVETRNNDFKEESFELKPYDADNQSFLINAGSYGDVLLPVPATDAPSFKDNWNSIKNNIKPTFVFDGKDAVLSKLTFSNGGKDYVYDSHTEAKYAVADIKYNFAPIKVDDVDFDIKDLDISAPAIAQTNVGQTVAKQSENVSGLSKKTVEVEHKSISAGNGGGGGTLTKSDVDVSIPRVAGAANNTFALVIANENYRREGKVAFAQNDGKIFAEYLKSTLGLPEKNIQLYCDASLNDIRHGVNGWLRQIGDAFGSDANIIVYYAGHGIPDEKNGDAYLLPVDGYGSDVLTGYSIKDLYETLGNLPSRQTLLLMDACFSGAQRDGSMMASNARGVRIKPKDNQVSGNLIVLSATQGDETAYPYEEQQHGMFTYFLLKKLKEGKRNVTLGDLADYVITNVKRASIVNNGKLQTPTVSVAPAIAPSWKSLRLSE